LIIRLTVSGASATPRGPSRRPTRADQLAFDQQLAIEHRQAGQVDVGQARLVFELVTCSRSMASISPF